VDKVCCVPGAHWKICPPVYWLPSTVKVRPGCETATVMGTSADTVTLRLFDVATAPDSTGLALAK